MESIFRSPQMGGETTEYPFSTGGLGDVGDTGNADPSLEIIKLRTPLSETHTTINESSNKCMNVMLCVSRMDYKSSNRHIDNHKQHTEDH